MVLGSSRALNEALQHATTELLHWLMDSYGFDERGASLLLGHIVIGQQRYVSMKERGLGF